MLFRCAVEAPPKDLVRIRQAVQSETSYPGQPEAAPPGRTETGPGRLTFQRRAQVPAGEEERRAGHERGDHVYEKVTKLGLRCLDAASLADADMYRLLPDVAKGRAADMAEDASCRTVKGDTSGESHRRTRVFVSTPTSLTLSIRRIEH